MTLTSSATDDQARDSLGPRWLVRMRWMAALGQLLVFSLATNLAFISAPVRPFWCLWGALCLSNVLLSIPVCQRLLGSRQALGLVLAGDVLLLTGLLYFYGGYTNPFGMFYLLHVVLAALLLGGRWTWGISTLSSLCYAALFWWYVPVVELAAGHQHAGAGSEFGLHLQGMLVAFILMALLVSGFMQRMREEIRWRDEELQRRAASARQLSAVTTLAASVAHELGSPLGTMTLVVDDLHAAARAQGETPQLLEDLALLRQELQRCTGAMARLRTNADGLEGEALSEFSLREVLGSVQGAFGHDARLSIDAPQDADAIRLRLPREGLRHVIISLIKNALEASGPADGVSAVLRVRDARFEIAVVDRGRGMSEQELQRIGEPFFTTKHMQRGMGLGLFISRLFAERLGGEFRIASRLGAGTQVEVLLPQVVAT